MINAPGMLILHNVKYLCMSRVLKCFYVYHNMHGSIIDKTAYQRKKYLNRDMTDFMSSIFMTLKM